MKNSIKMTAPIVYPWGAKAANKGLAYSMSGLDPLPGLFSRSSPYPLLVPSVSPPYALRFWSQTIHLRGPNRHFPMPLCRHDAPATTPI